MTGRICGTGSCVPSFVMDNNDIAKLVDTSDEWIRERTGVVRRHIIREETTVSMAVQAGRQALENAGITADDVDLIIVSTISSNVILPCTACEVQKELGAKRATCFDLSAACTGFVVAYNTAAAYLNAGVYQTALIIGSESLSNLTNWKDRGTCILFGDGAGAAVLKSEDMRYYLPVTHSDGSKGEALCCRSRYDRSELSPEDLPKPDEKEYLMQMDGREVFMFAVKSVPQAVKEVLEKNNVAQEEISFYILHRRTYLGRKYSGMVKNSKNKYEKENKNMLEQIKKMVADNLGVEESKITENASFKDDLGADSLDLFELTMALEDEYGIEIPSEDLEKIVTVGDVVEYVNAHKE